MVISRTPFRVSFFGGGTDFPSWYLEHGGTVLAATIDKYCYLTARYLPPFFEHRYRAVYSKIETTTEIDQIAHPVVREALRFMDMKRGIEIHHDGDLPARSGMGSSSAFTVGLLHALHAVKGRMVSKHQLALEAIHMEQEVLKETVGSQDQIMTAYGGFNQVAFLESGEITVRPIILPQSRLSELCGHLMLFYTGVKRTSSDIASTYVNQLEARRRQLRILKDLVTEAIGLLTSQQHISGFGYLLHEAWQIKRNLSASVSNHHVDEIYDEAREAGALGGKLLGAGGGGFLLLFVPPERQADVKSRLNGLICVPFEFDFMGSQIIYYRPDPEYAEAEAARAAAALPVFRELIASAKEPAAFTHV
jgi:D-glycero-alpha-D-manno-heptose-7-phosphate kinase